MQVPVQKLMSFYSFTNVSIKTQFTAAEQTNILVDLIARKLANSSNSMV